ncbi:outer membrane lipoprotein-sorting protein [Pseudomonas sp. Irchel s3a18]|uniref:outer membrane lipoprotein-sorting protein n=1 Tax=Pseudomonas sp. Irchel s3a18 TaxID=2009053 RepID=UPI000BA49FD1|nr:outer membrane lipoprotein-sorting protein [Pseudomonas sp. Irchel s3a18]
MSVPNKLFALLLVFFCGYSSASELSPKDLVLAVQRNASPADEQVEIDMLLVDKEGSSNRRTATFYQRQREPGSDQDMRLIRFSSPAEMDGSAVLTLENKGRADDQWLYLPAYHTSRKIPSSNRSDRYMGTDFFYEDVSDDKVELYDFSLISKDSLEGRDYLIVEQIPKDAQLKKETFYGKKRLWIDPERLVTGRIDFYDKAGELIKRMSSSAPQLIEKRWRMNQVEMTDFRITHKTTINYHNRKLDQGLNTQMFTVRSLERGR